MAASRAATAEEPGSLDLRHAAPKRAPVHDSLTPSAARGDAPLQHALLLGGEGAGEPAVAGGRVCRRTLCEPGAGCFKTTIAPLLPDESRGGADGAAGALLARGRRGGGAVVGEVRLREEEEPRQLHRARTSPLGGEADGGGVVRQRHSRLAEPAQPLLRVRVRLAESEQKGLLVDQEGVVRVAGLDEAVVLEQLVVGAVAV
mmetsp:Transcript_27095/g.79784  ORF Transcript_27095/g.79784 Transcript_27095/m.79784 type:complete len:202 (-) Transcript_27095:906-1511(-)